MLTQREQKTVAQISALIADYDKAVRIKFLDFMGLVAKTGHLPRKERERTLDEYIQRQGLERLYDDFCYRGAKSIELVLAEEKGEGLQTAGGLSL